MKFQDKRVAKIKYLAARAGYNKLQMAMIPFDKLKSDKRAYRRFVANLKRERLEITLPSHNKFGPDGLKLPI